MPRRKQPKALGDIDWENYYRLDDIYAWLDTLVEKFPTILKLETIGNSYEGRPIKMITLSKKAVCKKKLQSTCKLYVVFLINRVIEPY